MSNKFNKEKLREFFYRRKINFITLITITFLSVIITLICRISGFMPGRIVILELVSLMLIVLCVIQAYRMRRSFRTMKDFKGKRKRKKTES